jgi:hypothetical protein
MTKSTDGGVSMGTAKKLTHVSGRNIVDGGINVYNAPAGAADIFGGTYDGNIYVSYANMDTSNHTYNDWNIEFMKSSDGGVSWSKPFYINDDPTGMGAMYDQFHPWLFCNEEGTLIIIFYDQRMDILNHYLFDVFAAYSFDGGESFTSNHRLTEVSSSPSDLKNHAEDPDKSPSKAGLIAEYIGVTAFKDHVNAVWTDARNGNQEVWGANYVIPILKPRLLAPEIDASITTAYPHFDWATAWKENDDQYRLEVSTDNQFINMVFTETSDSSGLVSSINALSDGLYYWRVKAFKILADDSSDYSDVWSFTVGDYVCADPDGDGYGDPDDPETDCPFDNCPDDFNLDQADTDADGLGDVCDNCPDDFNPDQADSDQNNVGDICQFVCGDVNNDEVINIKDITDLIKYKYKSGSAPVPEECVGDVNNDDAVNIKDITDLIKFKYKGGDAPDINCCNPIW